MPNASVVAAALRAGQAGGASHAVRAKLLREGMSINNVYAIVEVFAEVVGTAGYTEVVPPMFEHLEVFQRLGDATEVVRKEMYDFEDKGGRRVALRPEQTASVVRAFAQHRPTPPWKIWYAGPNFRYERAQKGRFRQFDQVGVEALGPEDAHLDAEVIALAWRFYQELGLREVVLQLNSLGGPGDRARYIETLRGYLTAHREDLTEESLATLEANPLRVLDSKRDGDAEVVAAAPNILDHLSDEASAHFDRVRDALDTLDITYTVVPSLVRGLDYYVRTTFEFIAEALDAAQDAIGGGGRSGSRIVVRFWRRDFDIDPKSEPREIPRVFRVMLDHYLIRTWYPIQTTHAISKRPPNC